MSRYDSPAMCHDVRMFFDRILVVAPHPDDEVIGCGGLLARAHREGKETTVVVVAVEDDDRQKELEAAAIRLGVTNLASLWKKPFIDDLDDHTIVGRLDEMLDLYRPDLVLVPSLAGYHQEHRRVASLAVSAMRPGGGRSVGHAPASVWYYEAPADVSSPTGTSSPTITVSLTRDDLDAKIDAMRCHASQVRPSPSERSLDALEALAILRGAQVGVPLGEAYASRRLIL